MLLRVLASRPAGHNRDSTSLPPEAQLGYLIATIVVVAGGSIILAVRYVRYQLRPVPRPSRTFGRRAPRPVAPGDDCACGGTIGRSGRTSPRFGELLGCTACNRLWTADGRRIRRRPNYRRQPEQMDQ